MANLSTRKQHIKQLGLEGQLKKLEQSIQGLENDNIQLTGENDELRKIIERLMNENDRLKEENSRLRGDVIEVEPFSDISSLPSTRPSTADTGGYVEQKDGREQQPSLLPPMERTEETITDEIIRSVRSTLLEASSSLVKEQFKDFLRDNGDVLVVHFQLTKHAQDIYGYTIVDSEVLNNPELLNQIDNKNNIQLYIHRGGAQRDDLKTAGTVSVVVHNNGWVESPMKVVGPGDIVMWIRTNEPINNIKSNLGSIFKNKFLGTLGFQCGRGSICSKTTENVNYVSEIISGTYRDVKPEPVRPEPVAIPPPIRPPPASNIKSESFAKYASMVKIPKLFNNPQYVLYDLYWASGEVPQFLTIDLNATQGPLSDLTSVEAMQNAKVMAAVSKEQRIYYSTSMKNIARYIMEMIDYFHQILDVYFDSQTVIDNNRAFFYGPDIGRHKTLVGPTPQLADLMEHMFDIRQGFTYIDELCNLILRPLSQVDTDNKLFRDFVSLVVAGAKRFESTKHPLVDYGAYKRVNYIYRVKKEFMKLAPLQPREGGLDDREQKGKKIPEKFFSSKELSRLYSGISSTLSLGNYWDAAVVLGLEKEFSYLEPALGHKQPKLDSSLEQLTSQLSLGEAGLYLPWIVDGYQIRRPQFEFVSAWRNIIAYIFQDATSVYLYKLVEANKLDKLGNLNVFHLTDPNTIKRDDILKKLLRSPDRPLRQELRNVTNEIMKDTCEILEKRYKMYKEEAPISLQPRETAVTEHEYYTYMTVFDVIKATNPDWDSDLYRARNLAKWLEIPGAFHPGGGEVGGIELHSLDNFEWNILTGLERAFHEKQWRNESENYY